MNGQELPAKGANKIDVHELHKLVSKWEHNARRAFEDAKFEKDPMGKRLIEHGAMCYFNCSQALKRALVDLPPQP
ncbi:hypothetical protein [Crenobacter cavernae]|uniref:HEPN domain-containing protein n=1 Tax=Crenobacter cavernae TaxID=2290923 RepID=A0ABY0FAK6_9NEIS|nr:hypothetical protein [Crenobacter cavernae]RXZ42671.1 hypothetical protein EBB06_12305 [Crenobacter cavernae]